ncbi:MAG TPA: prepilin-type N-terminal cleavage/methylation domain-containing protein [Kofleriaceae bacterium]|nr:prepilin-type N-terminal cleavage/methylation domain-containing protein [Kofleriaceae bacterium]
MRTQRGFTIIEIMIVVVIIGVLAAIAIPMFTGQMTKSKQSEALLRLNELGKNAKVYYQANTTYPQGTAGVLPGADGDACKGPGRKFAADSAAWQGDQVWLALDFHVDEANLFSYHYTSTTANNAEALAVGDTDCDKHLVTYKLALSVPENPAGEIIKPTSDD